MQERLAFTASFLGNGAVVSRAIEGLSGPVIDQQFGQFETWTQANAFASHINEGLDLKLSEVRQIVTSSMLCANDLLQAVDTSQCVCGRMANPPIPVSSGLQFLFVELDIAVTFCRMFPAMPSFTRANRLLHSVRGTIFHALYYVLYSDICAHCQEKISGELVRLLEALQEAFPQQENSEVTLDEIALRFR